MEEEPKKLAYIVPCFPPHIHPDARIRREGHKPMSYAHVPMCENGTECRMLDSKRCGLQKGKLCFCLRHGTLFEILVI